MARQLQWMDVFKGVGVLWVIKKVANTFGISVPRFGTSLFLVAVIRALYKYRAPPRSFPNPEGYFKVYPIVGQIGGLIGLFKGTSQVQREMAKIVNYQTIEIVRFGPERATALMDPRDREHVLKTNWKNYVKNEIDGPFGFQELFAEVMGRGIFAVVSLELIYMFYSH
jgi:hypothetical protein